MDTPAYIFNRRDFMKTSASTAVSLAALGTVSSRLFAAGSDLIRVGVIGCGGRGTGAAINALETNAGIVIAALADAFQDRIDGSIQEMKKWCDEHSKPFDQCVKVTPDTCYTGFKAYQVLLANRDIHSVILATPPIFRPLHFEAAINAGKHVFMEKPVAVDPVGVRRVIAAGEKATQKGIHVTVGTQRRRMERYRYNQYAVAHGVIGDIKAGRIFWCGEVPWYQWRQAGQSDADYLARNWVNFYEMSGDHIVEQHVHNIDVANWFIGRPPRMALGCGGRARRKNGNQYDFFSIDYDYGDDVHIHSVCRQITGCYNRVGEALVGTQGRVIPDTKLSQVGFEVPSFEQGNEMALEHLDLFRAMRGGTPVNEARRVAESTLSAIMGRISAYTGQIVKWSNLMNNENSPLYHLKLSPSPEDFEAGTVIAPKENIIPVPGRSE